MKNLIKYLIIIATLGLFACNDKTDQPTTEENADAALELYCKYADNADLTVAYLGDFAICGKPTDAVMIQANNEEDWVALQQDFGIIPFFDGGEPCDSTTSCNVAAHPNDDKVVSVGIGIDADFLDEAMFDTLTDISQISQEELDRLANVVAKKIRSIMDSFQASDSMRPDAAVVIGQGAVAFNDDRTYDEYIMSIATAIVTGLVSERIAQGNEAQEESDYLEEGLQRQKDQNEQLMTNAMSYGHCGYITASDRSNRTVWLFFYDNQEECNNILTHIREDIIVNE